MEIIFEIIIAIVVIVIAVVIVYYVLIYTLGAIYFIIASICHLVYTIFETLFGTTLIPDEPAIMWAVWGILIGGALGFWTIAPVYGLRKSRRAIIVSPIILMIVVAAYALNHPHT